VHSLFFCYRPRPSARSGIVARPKDYCFVPSQPNGKSEQAEFPLAASRSRCTFACCGLFFLSQEFQFRAIAIGHRLRDYPKTVRTLYAFYIRRPFLRLRLKKETNLLYHGIERYRSEQAVEFSMHMERDSAGAEAASPALHHHSYYRLLYIHQSFGFLRFSPCGLRFCFIWFNGCLYAACSPSLCGQSLC